MNLFLELEGLCLSLFKDLNIMLMYVMFWIFVCIFKLKNGWGKKFCENVLGMVDDIEWIWFYRNCLCYMNVIEMKIGIFNDYVFDFIGVNMVNILDIFIYMYIFFLI